MNTKILGGLAAASLLLAACTAETSKPVKVESTVANHPKQLSFHVEGMSCGVECPPAVQAAIAKLEGIEASDVEVNYDTKTATVGVDENDPSVEQIVASVEGTQFTLTAN
ncbi:MAG: cation transporter [Planctomycetota bacterium]